VPIRKEGKLPAARMTVEYSLEYGESRLDIHRDALEPGTAVYIVDDVLATGGTALAAAKLVEVLGAQVVGTGFLIELEGLGGRQRLSSYRIDTLLRFAEE
jgi:adenine phosphoribosyltransferase